jgi:predicted nucleic acid-binding protein
VVLVLDSGGVSRLAERSRKAAALILALREVGLWPPLVPSVVLVECLRGHAGRDAVTNRFLKTCDIVETVPQALARRAAVLRGKARRGSAVDAVVVALAEPGGTVVTSDPHDLNALAGHADDVAVERV